MHSDDKQWIKQQITSISVIEYRKMAWTGYAKKFNDAFNAEPVEHKKENKARRVANNALREFVKKVSLLNG